MALTAGKIPKVKSTQILEDGYDVGIADTNLTRIDSATVASGEYAKFTANGLESKSFTEVKTDLDLNNVSNILNKLDATAAPTANDDSGDGYSVGSQWVDITNDKTYFCQDASAGAAVWQEVGSGSGGGLTQDEVTALILSIG